MLFLNLILVFFQHRSVPKAPCIYLRNSMVSTPDKGVIAPEPDGFKAMSRSTRTAVNTALLSFALATYLRELYI